jgi:hypothetical protein
LIAIAGLIGLLRLGRLLRAHCSSPAIARSTVAAWVAGNAFLGAQFSWILRPFFGNPRLEVAFLRDNPMQGSFYETVAASFQHSIQQASSSSLILGTLSLLVVLLILLRQIRIERLNPKSP